MIPKPYFCWLAVLLTSLTLFASYAVAQEPEQSAESIEHQNRVPDLLRFLDARPGSVIADVGCGDGFYSLRIARAVAPNGRVVAEDIDESALRKLREHVAAENVGNLDVVLGSADDPHLGIGRLDAVLVRNAYHEMRQHKTMLRHIYRALKPGGRFVVVEPLHEANRGLSRKKQVAEHNIAIGIAERELRAAGFKIVRRDPEFVKFTKEPGAFWLILAQRP